MLSSYGDERTGIISKLAFTLPTLANNTKVRNDLCFYDRHMVCLI
jgi:hypothetical protein